MVEENHDIDTTPSRLVFRDELPAMPEPRLKFKPNWDQVVCAGDNGIEVKHDNQGHVWGRGAEGLANLRTEWESDRARGFDAITIALSLGEIEIKPREETEK